VSTAPLDLSSFLLSGSGSSADISAARTSTTMLETIQGASTVTVAVRDEHRRLVNSSIATGKTQIVLGGESWQLCKVGKKDNGLTLTFEEEAVARLRTHDKPFKVSAGVMTRVEFCRRLIAEEGWIAVVAAPYTVVSAVELARGSLDQSNLATTANDKPENTWDCINRVMGEIGWRVLSRGRTIYLAPDDWLLKHTSGYTIVECTNGVDYINVDYDIGKPAATASFTCRCGFADLNIGDAVTMTGLGVASTKPWLVSQIQRSADSFQATVNLMAPQPTLKEPTSRTGNAGKAGYDLSLLAKGDTGTPTTGSLEKFVQAALAQRGKPYDWGAAGPGAFDCSGLVLWAASLIGVTLPHNSGDQYELLKSQGKSMTVAQAIRTRGALLFEGEGGSQHVVISLGNGKTIEAMGTNYGIVMGKTAGRHWTVAAHL